MWVCEHSYWDFFRIGLLEKKSKYANQHVVREKRRYDKNERKNNNNKWEAKAKMRINSHTHTQSKH